MRRALTLVAIVTVAAACSSGAAKLASQERNPGAAQPVSWPATAATLSDRLDGSSSNVCGRGAPACLDLIVSEMTRRFDLHTATCDHRAPFELAYLDVTKGIRDAERRAPVPGVDEYLRHLDAVFAQLDFAAADAVSSGRNRGAPRAWQIALTAADGRQVTTIGDLLLGMNAHISRDLAFAVATVGLTLPDGTNAKAAFNNVNEVLATVNQPMMAEVARRFDPTVAAFDLSLIAPGASTVDQVLATWRDESWTNAVRLTKATDADRPAVAASIEANAETRGLAILAATHYVPFVTDSASRDQFCAAHGRG